MGHDLTTPFLRDAGAVGTAEHRPIQYWPMFRGADRTGISKDKGLLKSWPKTGPPLAWKTDGIGAGFSSVSVMGDKVFTMGDWADGCYLFAIDRAKGGKLWELKVGATGGGGGFKAPARPPADGEFVFALTATAIWSAPPPRTARKYGGRTSKTTSAVAAGGATPNRR